MNNHVFQFYRSIDYLKREYWSCSKPSILLSSLALIIKCKTILFVCLTLISVYSHAENFTVVEKNVAEIQQALDAGKTTSVQLVKQYLKRIEVYDQQNTTLNALITVNTQALKQAAALDVERTNKGSRGPLHGIPIVLKDNFNTFDLTTSGGSVALAGFIPTTDAFQVDKLRRAGAIIIAKANMDDFAAGSSGYSSLGGQTKNPYSLDTSPGGSSAGTGVAVAANFATAGMGTNTCGSIGVPSSYNNVVGFRPTKGLSSMTGVIPLSPLYDVAGPIGKSAYDIATIMDIVIGYDPKDPATALVETRAHPGFIKQLGRVDLSTLRLGKLVNYFDENPNSDVNKVIDKALDKISQEGVTIINIDTPLIDNAIKEVAKFKIQYKAGMAQYLQLNPNLSMDLLNEIARLGMYPEYLDQHSPYSEFIEYEHDKSQSIVMKKWMALLNQVVEQVMINDDLDALIFPMAKHAPNKLNAPHLGFNCALSAMSGMPSLTLPAGFTREGLPVDITLLGKTLEDENVVAIGYEIEKKLKSRKLPRSTPKLVDGQIPQQKSMTVRFDEIVEIELTYDAINSELRYLFNFFSKHLNPQKIYAICLHKKQQGPIIQCLPNVQSRPLKGVIELSDEHITALSNNELFIRLYSPSSPKGQLHQKVKMM